MSDLATIIPGDCRETLKTLPAQSVHCVCTSPPYFGLRNYNHPEQLGLEPTPQEFVAALVGVFREVWRVLRDDGCVWLNLGDSYAGGAGRWGSYDDLSEKQGSNKGSHGQGKTPPPPAGFKPKDLLGIPWRTAFALQDAGWYLRSDVIWSKGNCLPESVEDRPTKSHEYVFLLTKSPRYFYDSVAVREPYAEATLPQLGTAYGGNGTKDYAANGVQNPSDTKRRIIESMARRGGRNRRSVWTINTQPFSAASLGIRHTDHYAAFPEELARICILAGTSEHGCCSACGAPWRRVTEKEREFRSGSGRSGNAPNGKHPDGLQGGGETGDVRRGPCVTVSTLGWEPGCACSASESVVPCTVLDPFAGTGTTGAVAVRHGRRAVLCELNEDYQEIIRRRVERERNLFSVLEVVG